MVKPALYALLAGLGLAGCQGPITLEQAQAACAKKGGLLVVVYTQEVTLVGVGPEVATPGNCVSPSKFDPATPPPAPTPPVPN